MENFNTIINNWMSFKTITSDDIVVIERNAFKLYNAVAAQGLGQVVNMEVITKMVHQIKVNYNDTTKFIDSKISQCETESEFNQYRQGCRQQLIELMAHINSTGCYINNQLDVAI